MTITTTPTVRSEPKATTVPLGRVVLVELRKMFDTRSGFWLMASIVIIALATMVGVVLFAPHEDLTYYTFAKALGFPMTLVLPMIAILSITGEWSQRTGLTTFTLVPHRSRVLWAKTVSSVIVGVVAMIFALAVGVVGNVVGTTIAGTDLVWDVSATEVLCIVLGSLLCLLTGTMLGMLFRSSAGALVAYFVIALVFPTIAGILAASEPRFVDIQPWVDANWARSFLFEGTPTVEQWAQIGVTTVIWLVLPALLGVRLVMKSEVK